MTLVQADRSRSFSSNDTSSSTDGNYGHSYRYLYMPVGADKKVLVVGECLSYFLLRWFMKKKEQPANSTFSQSRHALLRRRTVAKLQCTLTKPIADTL